VADLSADGAMRHGKLIGRQRHAPMAARRLEGLERVEGGEAAAGHVRKMHTVRQLISILEGFFL
jgi:hypothetical protein